MNVVVLAGGSGSRLRLEGDDVPKALIPIGGRPILWHVMAIYAHQGYRDFLVALGHHADRIRDWFRNPPDRADWPGGEWRIDFLDTGPETETGGRVRRIDERLRGGTFMLTWCDGLADVDLRALTEFHRSHGRLATVTAVHPSSRFGHLTLDGERVTRFREKPRLEEAWVNGAFYVLEPGVLDLLTADTTDWDRDVLPRLAREGELMAFRHETWWQCMDTWKEALALDELWRSGDPPWKRWT